MVRSAAKLRVSNHEAPMIDHISVPVRDLELAKAFYEAVLAVLGYTKLDDRPATVGFGKEYSEFWINLRPSSPHDDDPGTHVALRAKSKDMVDAFHAAAIANGGVSDGGPGLRGDASDGYYAAFIRDPDGNKIEAVTFLK
jgi:catechol 2,3-dioxygenase-like lactoylglutathione lyase family enzyme